MAETNRPSLESRLEGLFLGAAIGDAASQPIEWIYDLAQLAEVTKDEPPEFLPESHCPFFNLQTGLNTCYFHQTVCVAESLVAKKAFDLEDLQERFFRTFGPGTPYEGDRTVKPFQGPWRNFCVTQFCDRYAEGQRHPHSSCTTDFQSDCLLRILPLAIVFSGTKEYLTYCDQVIVLLQYSEEARAWGLAFSWLLEQVILSDIGIQELVVQLLTVLSDSSRPQATSMDQDVSLGLANAISSSETPYVEFQKELGQGCGLKMGVPGVFHVLSKYPTSFVDGLRLVMKSGGDVVSRSALVGGLIAARTGSSQIPTDWEKKTTKIEEYRTLCGKLIELRNKP